MNQVDLDLFSQMTMNYNYLKQEFKEKNSFISADNRKELKFLNYKYTNNINITLKLEISL